MHKGEKTLTNGVTRTIYRENDNTEQRERRRHKFYYKVHPSGLRL